MSGVDRKNLFFSREIQDLPRGLRTRPGCTLPAKCCEKPMWESQDEEIHSQASLPVLVWYWRHTAKQKSKEQRYHSSANSRISFPLLPLNGFLCFIHSWDCIIKHSIKSLYDNVRNVQPTEVVTLLMGEFICPTNTQLLIVLF